MGERSGVKTLRWYPIASADILMGRFIPELRRVVVMRSLASCIFMICVFSYVTDGATIPPIAPPTSNISPDVSTPSASTHNDYPACVLVELPTTVTPPTEETNANLPRYLNGDINVQCAEPGVEGGTCNCPEPLECFSQGMVDGDTLYICVEPFPVVTNGPLDCAEDELSGIYDEEVHVVIGEVEVEVEVEEETLVD